MHITETAAKLMQNLQDIEIIDRTWRAQEARENGSQEQQESFSNLVKRESLVIIRERWKDVAPEQLAQLVRIYANDGSFAKEMLSNYFQGPPDRCSQRVLAYYNFVSATLDLLGEDEPFHEGMKIVLYATDILPRDPSFIEQVNLVSLPAKGEEEVFKNSIVIESITKQAMYVSSQDFTEYLKDNENFVWTDRKILREWPERKKRVTDQIGSYEANKRNKAVTEAMNFFLHLSREPLSEERKQILKDKWPYNLAFDENDPLNQKLNRILAENKSSSM